MKNFEKIVPIMFDTSKGQLKEMKGLAMEFKKAKRSLAKLKIGITGASGSGKTLSS